MNFIFRSTSPAYKHSLIHTHIHLICMIAVGDFHFTASVCFFFTSFLVSLRVRSRFLKNDDPYPYTCAGFKVLKN